MKKLNIILLSSFAVVIGANASTPIKVKFIDAPMYSNHLNNHKATYTFDENHNRLTQEFRLTSAWNKPIVNLAVAANKKTINYVYDFKNRKATRVDNGAYEGNMVYTFNKNGLVLSGESTKGLIHTSYEYDKQNHIKTSLVEFKHHDYTKKGKYTYNKNGKVTEYRWTDTPNINYSNKVTKVESFGIKKYKYFENGNIESMETNLIFNANTKNEYTLNLSCQYDEYTDGKVLSRHNEVNKYKSTANTQFNYDEQNNLTTYIHTKKQNNEEWTKHTATYNEQGDLVSDYVERS